MAGLEAWERDNAERERGLRAASPPEDGQMGLFDEVDVELVVEQTEVFVDPIVVCGPDVRERELEELGARLEKQRTLVNGIQVHRCPKAEPGRLYLLDRPGVVDADGLCLVCGQPTV